MQYVTYIALICGAAQAKKFVIDINEEQIQKSMQIEQQEFQKLTSDPAFQEAAQRIGMETATMLAKDQAKLITHERGILMPSVRGLTKLLNAMLIEEEGCEKEVFETCLSARPQAFNPLSIPPEWEYGRLRQCTEQSGCEPLYNTWNRRRERKFQNNMRRTGGKAAQNFQKLAMAYEKAYFEWGQKTSQDWGTISVKYLESEKSKGLAYGCSMECMTQCTQSMDAYAQCGQMSVQQYPQWETQQCGCDTAPPIKVSGLFNLPSVTDNTRCAIDDAGSFNCGMIY